MAIFKTSPKSKEQQKQPDPQAPEGAVAKYPRPKILLLDLPDSAATALSAKGFSVSTGTLGKPYKVAKGSGFEPLIGKGDAPNYTEQEVVVVDLSYGELAEGPEGEKHRPNAEHDIWGKCDQGFLDPRVRTSIQLKKAFDRIHSNGGAFVIFADAKTGISLQIAWLSRFNELCGGENFPCDAWHFLSELGFIGVVDDHGHEMRPTQDQSALARLVGEHLHGGHFTCVLEADYRSKDGWKILAQNKFGKPVAIARCRSEAGSVIILPQLVDKLDFLTKLFTNVLPEIAPHLFPDIQRGRWAHRTEYELPCILELQAKKLEVERRAKAEILELEKQISKERAANGWLHNLLTGTDVELVEAVKRAFGILGFTKLVDVDEERDREGKTRREDLQIHDQSPLLIVDIKGVGGFPSDDDALQADKHAAIRMRELKRTDVVGLSIINHQRHMPPLERDNVMPFRQELLDAAEERSLGLITAWDLYRLVQNSRKLGWGYDKVRALFYRKGRIVAVPTHYVYLGKIVKAWTDKLGVVLEHDEIHVGERLAVEFPIEFEETSVDSIQVKDQNVTTAKAGDPAGFLWPAGKPKLREGLRVFRIPSAAE